MENGHLPPIIRLLMFTRFVSLAHTIERTRSSPDSQDEIITAFFYKIAALLNRYNSRSNRVSGTCTTARALWATYWQTTSTTMAQVPGFFFKKKNKRKKIVWKTEVLDSDAVLPPRGWKLVTTFLFSFLVCLILFCLWYLNTENKLCLCAVYIIKSVATRYGLYWSHDEQLTISNIHETPAPLW